MSWSNLSDTIEAGQLTFNQKFEIAKCKTVIESCNDIDEIKKLALSLKEDLMVQKNLTAYLLKTQLG
jgi:hypothetical protein